MSTAPNGRLPVSGDESRLPANSTYDRGTEALNATWQLLDRAPRGRGENFEGWPRKRDEYVTA